MPFPWLCELFTIITLRVRMRRDFWYQLIKKYFEQLIDSVWVLRPHALILRQTIFNIIVPRHAPAHARHTCGVLRLLMNPCTKYGAIDLFTLERWHGAVPCHFNESFIVFLCFGCAISQFFFRNFTFEIIDYFKWCSNGSSRPHLNQNARVLA